MWSLLCSKPSVFHLIQGKIQSPYYMRPSLPSSLYPQAAPPSTPATRPLSLTLTSLRASVLANPSAKGSFLRYLHNSLPLRASAPYPQSPALLFSTALTMGRYLPACIVFQNHNPSSMRDLFTAESPRPKRMYILYLLNKIALTSPASLSQSDPLVPEVREDGKM